MVPATAASVLSIALAGYLIFRHRDIAGAAVAVLLAASVLALGYLGADRERQLAGELEASLRRIAELEATPPARGFDPETRERLVHELSQFVGPTAFVLANTADLETTQYAREIANVLKDAGWKVPPSVGMSYRPVLLPGHDGIPEGVVLGVSPSVPEEFASALYRTFLESGVAIVRGPHWPGTEHPISVLVGPQPRR